MIGWFDGTAGASGDMLLGALVDVGVPLEILQRPLDQLGLGIRLMQREVTRGGLRALKVDVIAPPDQTHRGLSDVQRLLDRVGGTVADAASRVFQRLAEAEARVHALPIDRVHFHEVGALDAIADIIGCCAGFTHLALDDVHCSTLSVGSGTSAGTHGLISIPGPAVLELLRGIPITSGPLAHESTTPTGAAVLATVVTAWGSMPPMTLEKVGVGAGSREASELSNSLRFVLGEPESSSQAALLLEANIDDLDPRLWPHALTAILTVGAHDVWLTPITMKKGRPAFTLSVLCSLATAPAVRAAVFRETSTIGLREQKIDKTVLDRRLSKVQLAGLEIAVKVATLDGVAVNTSIEWEDIAAASASLGVPAKHVLAQATSLALEAATDL